MAITKNLIYRLLTTFILFHFVFPLPASFSYPYRKDDGNLDPIFQGDMKEEGSMLYQEGVRLLKEGKFIDASLKFKELIARYPDSGLAPLAGILIGDSYLREGETNPARFNDALEAYQEVRKGHPYGDVGAITLLRIGDTYQRLGFSYEATGSFRRIYSEFPGSRFIPKARVRTANAYLLSGRYQEALREAQAIIGSYPKSMEAADAFFMKGYTLNHMKRYGEAGKAYLEGSAKWPDYPRSNPVILYDMGDNYMRLGRYEMAREAFQALVNIYPKYNLSVKAMKNIGDSYRLEGKGGEAIKIYRETVDLFPEDESINGIKAILEEGEIFQSAINATKEKRIKDAINAFNDLLIKYPNGIKTDETEKALARLVKDYISDQFRSEGCLAASITYKKFKERVGAKIRDAGLYSLLGGCYMGLGLYNGAAEIYNDAIKMGGTGEETRYGIGEAGFLAGDYVNAGRHFEEFISSYPRSSRLVDVYRYLGISSFRSNDYKRSREAFARILDISKDSKHRVEGYGYIAGSYIADGSPDKASSAYKKLLDQLKEPDPGLFIRLGDALFASNDCKGAIAAYEKALEGTAAGYEADYIRYQIGVCQARGNKDELSGGIFSELAKRSGSEIIKRLADERGKLLSRK